MSIELEANQKQAHQELIGLIADIEKAMAVTIDATDSENVSYCLNERVALLSTCPRMMEIATTIYNWAKGKAADNIMADEKLLNAKQQVQINFLHGKLAKWEGLYTRAERCSSDLGKQIDGLRSILSYNKTLNPS